MNGVETSAVMPFPAIGREVSDPAGTGSQL